MAKREREHRAVYIYGEEDSRDDFRLRGELVSLITVSVHEYDCHCRCTEASVASLACYSLMNLCICILERRRGCRALIYIYYEGCGQPRSKVHPVYCTTGFWCNRPFRLDYYRDNGFAGADIFLNDSPCWSSSRGHGEPSCLRFCGVYRFASAQFLFKIEKGHNNNNDDRRGLRQRKSLKIYKARWTLSL